MTRRWALLPQHMLLRQASRLSAFQVQDCERAVVTRAVAHVLGGLQLTDRPGDSRGVRICMVRSRSLKDASC